MKITKRQLKRIIKEEKAKVLNEWFSDEHDPETGKRGGDYSTGRWDGLEAKIEDAIYSTLEMYMEVNGVDEAEAKQLVVDHVTEILEITR